MEGKRRIVSSTPKETGAELISDEALQRLTIGQRKPHNAPITLVDYDPGWAALFAREADRIRAVLGEAVVLVEHVGSTAVPGLAAKPIIDILLVVPNSADEASYVPLLESAGYVCFACGNRSGLNTVSSWGQTPILTCTCLASAPRRLTGCCAFVTGCALIKPTGNTMSAPSAHWLNACGDTWCTTPTLKPGYPGNSRSDPSAAVAAATVVKS